MSIFWLVHRRQIYDFIPQNHSGVAVIKYKFINVANPRDTSSIIITFDARSLTSTQTVSNSQIFGSPFPNPAVNFTSIQHKAIAAAEQASIEIYNILGNHLGSTVVEPLTTETVLSVASLSEGAYFCKFIVKGKTVGTKRFTVVR